VMILEFLIFCSEV